MRTPASVGLPAHKFPEWRKGQEKAVKDLLFTETRFNMLTIPTGGGKTAIYMGVAGVDEGRHIVITATRSLADQVNTDFHSMGLMDMRGRNNYTCDIDTKRTAAEAICTAGVYCRLMKEGGCQYYDAKAAAALARLDITNYSYWLHDEEGGALGDFSTLILDEAHKAPDQIADFVAVEVRDGELRSFNVAFPGAGAANRPAAWASQSLYIVEELAKSIANHDRRRAAYSLIRKLKMLCRLCDSEWIGSRPTKGVWRWDIVNPGELAEDLLFRGAAKVILVSASVRRKTLQLLGIDEKVKIIEQESTFPVVRRPIYYAPVCSVGRAMTKWDKEDLFDAVDSFVCKRTDRNGLLHSVSFDWAKEIYDKAGKDTRRNFLVHERGQDAADVLAKFRGSRRGTLLLSPSFDTGTDLPYEECEYQIIPKCPYPSFGSPLIQARMKRDPEYVPYVTMQRLVQMTGRGMRAADDQCETIVFDSNFGRLRGQYWDFAPKYFHTAVRTIKKGMEIPDPPRRLSR